MDVSAQSLEVNESLGVSESFEGAAEEPEIIALAVQKRIILMDQGRFVPDGESLRSGAAVQ